MSSKEFDALFRAAPWDTRSRSRDSQQFLSLLPDDLIIHFLGLALVECLVNAGCTCKKWQFCVDAALRLRALSMGFEHVHKATTSMLFKFERSYRGVCLRPLCNNNDDRRSSIIMARDSAMPFLIGRNVRNQHIDNQRISKRHAEMRLYNKTFRFDEEPGLAVLTAIGQNSLALNKKPLEKYKDYSVIDGDIIDLLFDTERSGSCSYRVSVVPLEEIHDIS